MTEYKITYTASRGRTEYNGVKFINVERPTEAITRLISWYPEHDFTEIKVEEFDGELNLQDIKTAILNEGVFTYGDYNVKRHSRGWVSIYRGTEYVGVKKLEEVINLLKELTGRNDE